MTFGSSPILAPRFTVQRAIGLMFEYEKLSHRNTAAAIAEQHSTFRLRSEPKLNTSVQVTRLAGLQLCRLLDVLPARSSRVDLHLS